MPKLLTLLACEKVIFDKQDAPTLVAVIGGVKAQYVPNPDKPSEIPHNALAPKSWAIFTIWESDVKEVGKTFHQKSEIIMPDKSVFEHMKADLPFVAKRGLNYNAINILAFPVGVEGILEIKLWLESPEGQMLVPETFYPIKVEYGIVVPQTP